MCEDHFTPDSFNPNSVIKGLKRNAVPIPFDSNVAQNNSKKLNRKRQNSNEQALYLRENITEQSVEKNAMPMPISDITDDQSEEPPLKTYKPAKLHFHSSMEEEDIMEWVNLEPHIHEKVSMTVSHKNESEENHITEKVNDSEIIIKSLKKENILLKKENNILKRENTRLQNIIKCLKYRAQRVPKFGKSKGLKQKKKIIKKLVHEQQLHPVAKAMIDLQLHTPRAPYTQEEKNLSRQLYYYSPSAFCRLRKAGCNLPGQRTIRMWLEEFDIQPGFCDFIFKKLKEKNV